MFASPAAAPATEATSPPTTTTGHPPGLYLLFLTEMWERMSFYGMRALMVLYMVRAPELGGFGWTRGQALSLYGTYGFLVYFMPLFGGAVADRYLGQRRSVTIGGALMVAGHFMLALSGVGAFYAGLGLLIVGCGMLKPNVSTMVGQLYGEHDARRDGAYTIYYMGINTGALIGPLICGTLAEKVSYEWGFASAGVGMLLGQIMFMLGQRRWLGDVGTKPSPRPHKAVDQPRAVDSPRALTKKEIDRLTVIVVLSLFTVFFWASYEQAGGLMNLFADTQVDRVTFGWLVPTTWFQSANPFFIITLGPIFAMLWVKLDRHGRDPSSPMKFAIGLVMMTLGFALMVAAAQQAALVGKANMWWLIGAYFFHTAGELCLSPVGLSMVSKLAPARYASMLMGFWFLCTGGGEKLAGVVGAWSEHFGELKVFAGIAVATAITAALLFALARPLVRRMHGIT